MCYVLFGFLIFYVSAFFSKLRAMKSLIYLNIFGLLSDKQIAALQSNIPEIKINSLKFSLVARPTVGIRRTSIWGLRVRE